MRIENRVANRDVSAGSVGGFFWREDRRGGWRRFASLNDHPMGVQVGVKVVCPRLVPFRDDPLGPHGEEEFLSNVIRREVSEDPEEVFFLDVEISAHPLGSFLCAVSFVGYKVLPASLVIDL